MKPSNFYNLNNQINPSETEIQKLIGTLQRSAITYDIFPVDDLSVQLMLELLEYGEPKFVGVTVHERGMLFTFMEDEAFVNVAVPYYQLTVYKTEDFSFYFEQEFIRLERNNKTSQLVQDILVQKAEFEGGGYYGTAFG